MIQSEMRGQVSLELALEEKKRGHKIWSLGSLSIFLYILF